MGLIGGSSPWIGGSSLDETATNGPIKVRSKTSIATLIDVKLLHHENHINLKGKRNSLWDLNRAVHCITFGKVNPSSKCKPTSAVAA